MADTTKRYTVEVSKNEAGKLDLVFRIGDQAIETRTLCSINERSTDVLELKKGVVNSNTILNTLMSGARSNVHIDTMRRRLLDDIYQR